MDASAKVGIVYGPAFTVTKVADVSSVSAKDDVITYTITVTNTGNVTLTNPSVSDPLLGTLGAPTESKTADGALEVGEVWTYTGSYTVKQADIDADGIDKDGNADGDGDIDNTVTIDFDETGPMDASAKVGIVYGPVMTVSKLTNGAEDAGILVVGDTVTWTYKVTNTGNVTLTSVTLVDDNGTPGDTGDDFAPAEVLETDSGDGGDFNIGDLDKDGELDVDEEWSYTAYGTVIDTSLLNDGIYVNTVTADSAETDEVTDTSQYKGFSPVTFTGNPQFNFPNDVNKIQPKLQGGSFTINASATIYWDIYTSDKTKAAINTATGASGYAGLQVEIVEYSINAKESIYRIYVTNQTDAGISLANNTDIVTYTTVINGSSGERGRLDLVNADPNIGNFNNFSNIENALLKPSNGFLFPSSGAVATDDQSNKVWASTDKTGLKDDDVPISPPVDGKAGGDLIYGGNQDSGGETLMGGAGNDVIDGRRGDDVLYGDDGNDVLYGGLGTDTLYGGNGNDTLIGSYGADHYYGGAGADRFVLEPGSFDWIHDFEGGDTILFGNFGSGTQVTDAIFHKGADTTGGTGKKFYYNTDADTLYFDHDGLNVGDAEVAIARFTNNPDSVIDAGDIYWDSNLM